MPIAKNQRATHLTHITINVTGLHPGKRGLKAARVELKKFVLGQRRPATDIYR